MQYWAMGWGSDGVGTDTYGGKVAVGGAGVDVAGIGVAVAVGKIGVGVGKTRVAVQVGEGVLLGVGAKVAVGEINTADGGGDGRSPYVSMKAPITLSTRTADTRAALNHGPIVGFAKDCPSSSPSAVLPILLACSHQSGPSEVRARGQRHMLAKLGSGREMAPH